MKRLLFCALLLAGCTALAQYTIVAKVQLVRMLVSVKDPNGRIVTSLTPSDFTIQDNGVTQEIKLFEPQTSQPLSIAVLLDASGSTHKDIRYELDAVNRFFKAAFSGGNADDAVSLYSFNWETRQHADFTRSLGQLQRRLKDVHPEAGTAMYDALYFASGDLRDREGRHVVVIVTDGGDTTSVKTYQQAIRALHRSDVVLYAVLVMPITNDAGRNIGGENALTTMSSELGGKVFAPSMGPALDQAFTDILHELRTQYLIGYYPQNLPPSTKQFHEVRVRARRPDYSVSARAGYYGEIDSPR